MIRDRVRERFGAADTVGDTVRVSAAATVVDGFRWWLVRLRPYAEAGYRRGVLDDSVVELVRDDGEVARLPRPRGGWIPAAWLLRDGETEAALEESRRHELSAAGRALLRALGGAGR